MKAAKLIARSDKLRPLVFGGILRETAANEWAEIIDREVPAALIEDLRKYGRHLHPCTWDKIEFAAAEKVCTCGFEAVLKGVTE